MGGPEGRCIGPGGPCINGPGPRGPIGPLGPSGPLGPTGGGPPKPIYTVIINVSIKYIPDVYNMFWIKFISDNKLLTSRKSKDPT